MSWGYKILIAYLVFIGMILSMVFVAAKQTNEMQDKNYYAKELAFQSVIDGKNNLNAINEKVEVLVHEKTIEIKLPQQSVDGKTEGRIRLLRPSDEKKDVEVSLQLNESHSQLLNKDLFSKGLYKLQLNWRTNEKVFYFEESVMI